MKNESPSLRADMPLPRSMPAVGSQEMLRESLRRALDLRDEIASAGVGSSHPDLMSRALNLATVCRWVCEVLDVSTDAPFDGRDDATWSAS